MKQTYLKFPTWKQLNAAPKINSRRIKFECYKSDAPVEVEVKELTDETDPENKALPDDSDEVKSLKKINIG